MPEPALMAPRRTGWNLGWLLLTGSGCLLWRARWYVLDFYIVGFKELAVLAQLEEDEVAVERCWGCVSPFFDLYARRKLTRANSPRST